MARHSLTNQNKALMIKALEKHKGVISYACKTAKISRQTFYTWVEKDPEFKKATDNIQDVALDFVESKLFNLIQKNDTAATIFYLKTKGKKRGYVERQEINLSGSKFIVKKK